MIEREIPEHPGYFIREDRSLWSRKRRGKPLVDDGTNRKRIATQEVRNGAETRARIWEAGRTIMIDVDQTFERLFGRSN